VRCNVYLEWSAPAVLKVLRLVQFSPKSFILHIPILKVPQVVMCHSELPRWALSRSMSIMERLAPCYLFFLCFGPFISFIDMHRWPPLLFSFLFSPSFLVNSKSTSNIICLFICWSIGSRYPVIYYHELSYHSYGSLCCMCCALHCLAYYPIWLYLTLSQFLTFGVVWLSGEVERTS
jgi:hypothetical protein